HRDFDRLVELLGAVFAQGRERLVELVQLLVVELGERLLAFRQLYHDQPSTNSRPIERALPLMILTAWSISLALRSAILASAISLTWLILLVPAATLPGSLEPDFSLAAF